MSRNVDIHSPATQTYMPRWQRQLEQPSISGFSHKREAEQRRTPFFCANAYCGRLMDADDCGLVCATCRTRPLVTA